MDLEEFLRVSDQFKLGDLITEKPHPHTVGLAELAQTDLHQAVRLFHEVDLQAMDKLKQQLQPLSDMKEAIRRTFDNEGRVFIAGCGATGRLALSIETLAREAWLEGKEDAVVAFMAGGDAALIRSIEAFEDYPEYGARQLRELGFCDNDLLLAITEGGETPFVIGACAEAASVSKESPWFLFCNPPEILTRVAERSRTILEMENVQPFCLDVGPMALSGSTRLQATTVQMLVTGAAIMEGLGLGNAGDLIDRFQEILLGHDPEQLIPLIEAETNVYNNEDLVLYQTDHYGITVLTDTTERSPTFSLAPFENRFRQEDNGSLCYLSLPGWKSATEAWSALLHRTPRTLEWPELEGKASMENLLGHDISNEASAWRTRRHPHKNQYPFLVHGSGPILEFGGCTVGLGAEKEPLLLRHLYLKCCLNLHSTLVMGRLGRFESNLMTWVKPSNFKLVDRAARYRQNSYKQSTGYSLDYEKAVREVFALMA